MIEPYLDLRPEVHAQAWMHPTVCLLGDVRLHRGASIWPHCALRGDQGGIEIGEDSNIQDGSVVHATGGRSTVRVGARVTVGHRVVLHGCVVEDDCLIGMGAIILDNAVVGAGSMVGAGALVLAGAVIPPGSFVLGSPAKVRGAVTAEHTAWIAHSWQTYRRLALDYGHPGPR